MNNAHHDGDATMTAAEFVALLNERHGDENREFSLSRPGRKFTRVVITSWGQASVHCFIDNATGDILKAEGWKRPARGARGNLNDVPETDPFGSYLYLRG